MTIAWDLVVNATSVTKHIDPGRPPEGIRPRYSGLREEGTANTPSSTISKTVQRPVGFMKNERMKARNGGDERTRTAGPLVANEVLSQLSYIPTVFRYYQKNGGERGIRTPGALAHSTVFETAPFNRSGISPRAY